VSCHANIVAIRRGHVVHASPTTELAVTRNAVPGARVVH
jgi:hypothetical protein